jgi:hypothetical protein
MRRLISSALDLFRRSTPRLDPASDAGIAAQAFDQSYYLATYPDVAEVRADALDHFMTYGWREGRNPNAEFSVSDYLAAFPDVAASGANPLVHYLTHGRPKGVPPESPLGFRFDIIEHQQPLEDRLASLTLIEVTVGTADAFATALASRRNRLAGLHVTFSHDDYSTNLGGMQFAIRREAARVAELGRDHLHLYSARPWPLVREAGETEALGVVLNGSPLGVFWPDAIVRGLREAAGPVASGRSFAIHSLLGHAPDEVADILAAVGLDRGVFWLHDFASLCAGFHLLRNGVEDCGAPPSDSPACAVCLFGNWRARHAAGHARLFARLGLTVAAPSQSTLALWQTSTDLPVQATVVQPLAYLKPRRPGAVSAPGRPFRFGYAGLPVAHKGWPAFMALASRFGEDPRYEFIHLGARRDRAMPYRFVEVRGGPDDTLAMQQALEAADIDAVLIWSLCRETFSFVAYEAVAAGCAIITGPDSGNVAAFVAQGCHGRVLADEGALTTAFQTGSILELARAQRRPMLYDLSYSALTLDLAKTPNS